MSNLIFGTDLDDCILLTSKAILNCLVEKTGCKIDFNDLSIYNFENILPEEYNNLIGTTVEEILKCSDTIQPIKNAITILNWISSLCLDEKVYVISHRPYSVYAHTKQVLENIGLKNFELVFTYDDGICDYTHKYEVINDLGISIFVEDRPSTVENIYKNTLATILVMDKPWTKTIAENERIYIVNNWMEIRDLFLTFCNRERCYGM